MPTASRFGSKTVPRSANAAGSKTATSARAPSRRTPRSERPIRSAGWPVSRMDGVLRGEQPLLADHEPPEPRRPGVRAVEERLGERAVRGQRRRVRARHAEPVRERLALLVLGVGVDDHHQLVRLVDALAAAGRRRRRAAPGRGRRRSRRGRGGCTRARSRCRAGRRATSRCRRSGSSGAPRISSRFAGSRRIAASSRRLGAERPGGQHRVEVRQPEGARVHVERDVLPRVARGLDELDAAAALLDPVARDEMRDLQPHLGVRTGADRLATASAAPSSRLRVCVA